MGPELVSPDHTPIQPFRSLFKPSPSSRSPSSGGNPLPHRLDPPWSVPGLTSPDRPLWSRLSVIKPLIGQVVPKSDPLGAARPCPQALP